MRTVDKSLIRRLKSIGRYFNNHIDDNYNLDRCEERYMSTYPIFSCMIIYDNMLGSIIYCNDGRIKDINIDLEKAIDCGTNEELFIAIAALRDDSDINQWFVDDNIGKDWIKSDTAKLCYLWIGEPDLDDPFRTEFENEGYQLVPYHKATVKELINHFR